MNQSTRDLTKLSRLIRAGALVHSADGRIYRCTSKLASEGTVIYRLADLQGKPVHTPADFCPVSPALARFAALMRFKVAFNQDFDLYVKAYIDAAGLPVDPTMNWSKWFQSSIAPKLRSRDEEVVDEAIHQIIIKTLAERSVLDSKNPHGFQASIGKFSEETQGLPLARQVTVFLMQTFRYRVSEANEYIQRFIFQKDTDSMWTTEDGEEDGRAVNILDTEDHASEGAYADVEADIEIDGFLKGFTLWLGKQFRENTVSQYILLFKLLYEEVKASEGIPRPADVFEQWHEMTGKSSSYFKVLFSNLPKLIALYIKRHLKDNYEVHPFIEILKHIGQSRKKKTPELEPAMASAKTADSGFYGIPVAPMDAGGEFTKDLLDPGSSESNNSGSGSFSMPGVVNDSAIGDLGELSELAIAASKKAKQWVLPKCKGCGKDKGAKACPACNGIFCPECVVNHHANNPSHDRSTLASAKSAAPTIDTDAVKTAIRDYKYTAGNAPIRGRCFNCNESGPVFECAVTSTRPVIPFQACSHCLNVLSSWGE
jgi:hypothetical protein